jgi:hypothetical protein
VIERRRRQLDLAAVGRLAMLGNHLVQQLELDGAQPRLVFLGEVAPLGDQALDARILLEIDRIDPRELVPDLQIAKIVAAESARRLAAVAARRRRPRASPPRQELGVARVDVDHPLPLGVEEILEDEVDVLIVEGVGGFRLSSRNRSRAVFGERLNCTSSDGTRLKVILTRGNSRRTATMP